LPAVAPVDDTTGMSSVLSVMFDERDVLVRAIGVKFPF
jgi:hypothetical protein